MSTAADTQTLQRTKFKVPSKWTVMLHNDDFTPMNFVVFVLQTIFKLTEDEAIEVMLKVHNENRAFVGEFTKEVAGMKAHQVVELAVSQEFPLLATAEELGS